MTPAADILGVGVPRDGLGALSWSNGETDAHLTEEITGPVEISSRPNE